MSAQTEFGYSIPDFLSGSDWEDQSYGNDVCAHVVYKKKLVDDDQCALDLWVWVDFPNPEERDSGPETEPFRIATYNYAGDCYFYRAANSEEECAQLINMLLHLYKEKPAFTFRTDAILFQYEERGQFLPGPIVPAHQSKVMERVVLDIRRAFGSEGYLNLHESDISLYNLRLLMIGGE